MLLAFLGINAISTYTAHLLISEPGVESPAVNEGDISQQKNNDLQAARLARAQKDFAKKKLFFGRS